jgi:hypothetical protein
MRLIYTIENWGFPLPGRPEPPDLLLISLFYRFYLCMKAYQHGCKGYKRYKLPRANMLLFS